MRISRVSDFLPDVTQQIHSLRARGVIVPHVSERPEDLMALDKSDGILCIK